MVWRTLFQVVTILTSLFLGVVSTATPGFKSPLVVAALLGILFEIVWGDWQSDQRFANATITAFLAGMIVAMSLRDVVMIEALLLPGLVFGSFWLAVSVSLVARLFNVMPDEGPMPS
jgi:hypothetical protein